MELIERKRVDFIKTGKNLEYQRLNNLNLRRYVCFVVHSEEKGCCDCENCWLEMDSRISRKELADVFAVSQDVIYNWERGICLPPVEDLLFYAQICDMPLDKIVMFEK